MVRAKVMGDLSEPRLMGSTFGDGWEWRSWERAMAGGMARWRGWCLLGALGLGAAAPAPVFDAEFEDTQAFLPPTPSGFDAGHRAVWKSTAGAGEQNATLGGYASYWGSAAATPGADPFAITAAGMSITARPAANPAGLGYVAGMLNTVRLPGGTFTGGRIEVSARLPGGAGSWPAIWLCPTSNQWPPEIDVMEMLGSDPATIYQSLHWGPDGRDGGDAKSTFAVHMADSSAGFHRYGVDFDSTRPGSAIRFFVDGRETYRATLPARMVGQSWFLMINHAIGAPGSWAGGVGAGLRFPSVMLVRYVRIYPPGTAP